MPSDYSTCFLEGFGFDMPSAVADAIALIPDGCQIRFPDKTVFLDIEYLPLPTVSLCHPRRMLFCFAIDTDGNEIYVDVSDTKYEIKLESCMDDRFGLYISNLATATFVLR